MAVDRVEINPAVMLGKPVIRGTRITVELILRKLSEGATVEDLLDAYPRLTRDDIQAALATPPIRLLTKPSLCSEPYEVMPPIIRKTAVSDEGFLGTRWDLFSSGIPEKQSKMSESTVFRLQKLPPYSPIHFL